MSRKCSCDTVMSILQPITGLEMSCMWEVQESHQDEGRLVMSKLLKKTFFKENKMFQLSFVGSMVKYLI